jgi:transposase
MAYSKDLRVSAVNYFLNHNLQYRDVADIFGLGVATLHRWVSAYNNTGRVNCKTSTGRPRILRRESDSAFQEVVLKNADSTLEKLSEIWEVQQDQKLSIFCISRAIRRLGLTRKKRLFVLQKEKVKITSEGAMSIFLA